MIPNVPTTATIFAGISAKIKTVTAKLQRPATIAMEAAAIIAPFINRGVSWRTINEAAFNSLGVLSAEGIISDELNTALSNTVNQVTSVNVTVQSLQNITQNMNLSNIQESLGNIDNITAVLRNQSATLSTTVDSYTKLVDDNKTLTTINNSQSTVQESINDINEYVSVGLYDIATSLTDINNLTTSINDLGFDVTGKIPGVNDALIQINNVAATVANVQGIANNLVATAENVKNIANNVKKINSFFENKRKSRKTLPTLPAAIDPRNNQYVALYNSLNTTIDSLNTTVTTLSSIPKIPFFS